jgi:RNA polymerase sigma factor (TIGR02999 family)
MDESISAMGRILEKIHAGDLRARDELLATVYDELRRVASRLMDHERPGHTLQPTALVHEAVVRVLGELDLAQVPNRDYLLAVLSTTMRRILVDHARTRSARKRGGDARRVPFDAVIDSLEARNLDVAEVGEALDRLAALSERQSQVVTLRLLGGFTMKEIAGQLGVSLTTVECDYRLARAWLHAELLGEGR